MNHDAAKSRAARLEEVARLGGQDAYRLHALQRLQPKTVIRESHCSPVHALCFNHTGDGGELGVLFATVGKDQATVYTDAHMEDYVGLVVQLHNQPSEHAAGGELQAACWVSTAGWTPHPHGDAALAVAGADPAISVVSVVEARVVQLLRGHEREVVELAAAPAAPRLLLSLAKGGNVRLWDVPEAACLASVATDATCLAMAPDGASFVAGTARGRLYRYDIAAGQGGRDIREESRAELQLQGGGGHTEPIDCVRFLPGGRLASKSADGRMFVWDLAANKSLASWRVPGCSASAGLAGRCQFAATPDGQYISVGNSTGQCFVYAAADGKQVAHVAAIKVSAPVRACALSADCRHLLAAVGNGFVFRFEYLGERRGAEEDAEEEQGLEADAEPMAA